MSDFMEIGRQSAMERNREVERVPDVFGRMRHESERRNDLNDPRRLREVVRQQSRRGISDSVLRVMINPVDESGADVEEVSEPFYIRRGAISVQEMLNRVGMEASHLPPEIQRAPADQLIAGITHEQQTLLHPSQYWPLRADLLRARDHRIVGRRETVTAHNMMFRPLNADGTLVTGHGEFRMDRGGRVTFHTTPERAEFDANRIRRGLSEMAAVFGGGQVNENDGGTPEAKADSSEELKTLEDGTTEFWRRGRLLAFTVDDIYYNIEANEGEEGYSAPPSAQPLFLLKEVPEYDRFIYDEDGYIDGGKVHWDAPFVWRSEGQSMVSMFALTDEDMVDDKVLEMHC